MGACSTRRTEKKRRPKSYDLFGLFTFFLPGVGTAWLLLASFFLLQILVTLLYAPLGLGMDALGLLVYVTVFALLLIPCSSISRSEAFRIEHGLAVSSRHFGKLVPTALFCVLGMLAAVFAVDPVSTWVQNWAPDAEALENLNKGLAGGSPVLMFLMVVVAAPLCEELFCRGILLRGMLTHTRPAAAIPMSALMFAVMHLNLAQGFVALCLGLLLGYVYYRTGCLWLTILMHATNNFLGFCLLQSPGLQASVAAIPVWAYVLAVLAGIAGTVFFVRFLRRIPLAYPHGNLDPVHIEDMI